MSFSLELQLLRTSKSKLGEAVEYLLEYKEKLYAF